MATIEDERPATTQIEKLNEKNYRSWATTVRAILREKKLFDVVEGKVTAPVKPKDDALDEDHVAYNTALEAYEKKAFPACRILLSAISSRLITYVEDEDDRAKIWTTLKDRLSSFLHFSWGRVGASSSFRPVSFLSFLSFSFGSSA
jgi:hypothetical protein